MPTKQRSDLKLLLLQIRENKKVQREELDSFVRYCQIGSNQIDVLNVFDQPDFSVNVADRYDALLVGGASDANVLETDKYPFVNTAKALLKECIVSSKPVFASCFGFQLAVLALGGEIHHKESDFEMGTVWITLESGAVDDPILRDTPDDFYAVSVHKQFAQVVPKNCIPLACTDECVHAFRVKNKPFWAFQFHPEVDKTVLIERLTFYKNKYTENAYHLDQVLKLAQETPEANALMSKFIQRILIDEEHLAV